MVGRIFSLLLLGGLLGAVLMYFLDPKQGNRRRKLATQQGVGLYHRSRNQIVRTSRTASARLYGLAQRLTHLKPAEKAIPNDETLTQRVRSRILRDPALHHHRININSEHGVINLRGEVDYPEQIRHLEQSARRIPGVREVKNLLHLPSPTAPISS